MILKEMPCQAAVEECQVPSKIAKEIDDERQRDRQEIAAAAEVSRVGRPGRSTDVHNVHRALGGRPARSTAMPDCRNLTLGFSGSTGPVDRMCCLQRTHSRVSWVDRHGRPV